MRIIASTWFTRRGETGRVWGGGMGWVVVVVDVVDIEVVFVNDAVVFAVDVGDNFVLRKS